MVSFRTETCSTSQIARCEQRCLLSIHRWQYIYYFKVTCILLIEIKQTQHNFLNTQGLAKETTSGTPLLRGQEATEGSFGRCSCSARFVPLAQSYYPKARAALTKTNPQNQFLRKRLLFDVSSDSRFFQSPSMTPKLKRSKHCHCVRQLKVGGVLAPPKKVSSFRKQTWYHETCSHTVCVSAPHVRGREKPSAAQGQIVGLTSA